MKAAGVEYDARMAELEKLEYPKPHREFIYGTFNAFAAKHPWVGQENIRPKSVAREMYETFQSFGEYVKEYDLQRAEGLLLRYLSDVYKALVQSVPELAKDEATRDIITYFGAIVRQVDSSLLDEWDRMRNPDRVVARVDRVAEEKWDVTRDSKAFTVLVRNEIYRLLRALAARDYEAAAEIVAGGETVWKPGELDKALAPFHAEHAYIRIDPEARSPKNTMITPGDTAWEVKQIILDPEEDNDWMLEVTIDLERSREAVRPVLHLRRIGT
jgi:hypothetical protein